MRFVTKEYAKRLKRRITRLERENDALRTERDGFRAALREAEDALLESTQMDTTVPGCS
jgi:predicted RNase H-like nuclease (RuvC/YqgF family)